MFSACASTALHSIDEQHKRRSYRQLCDQARQAPSQISDCCQLTANVIMQLPELGCKRRFGAKRNLTNAQP